MEYALSLSKPDFSLPSFQTYKLLLTLKLVEAGQLTKVCDYWDRKLPTVHTVFSGIAIL